MKLAKLHTYFLMDCVQLFQDDGSGQEYLRFRNPLEFLRTLGVFHFTISFLEFPLVFFSFHLDLLKHVGFSVIPSTELFRFISFLHITEPLKLFEGTFHECCFCKVFCLLNPDQELPFLDYGITDISLLVLEHTVELMELFQDCIFSSLRDDS